MYAASRLAGDRPPTYQGVMVVFHVIAFVLLAYFVLRRWGESAALWTLVVAVFSGYALTYADQQSPGILGIGAGVAVVFLYFDWIERRQLRAFALCFVVSRLSRRHYRSVVTALRSDSLVLRPYGHGRGDCARLLLPAATLVAWELWCSDVARRRAARLVVSRAGRGPRPHRSRARAFTHIRARSSALSWAPALALAGFSVAPAHPRVRRHAYAASGAAAPGSAGRVLGRCLVDTIMCCPFCLVFAVSAASASRSRCAG